MNLLLSALLFVCLLSVACAGTSITVASEYKKQVNIKIQGTGLGGCDVLLENGQINTSDCWCLWGTLNYSFCVYTAGARGPTPTISSNATVGTGRCPVVTGETLLCSDLSSLGNCYGKGYSCTVDSGGLCHCTGN